ncbi:metallophosphoesterase family protein [Marinobacterium mangrovicola]|uniref:3',5'-cyclic AMP phosphodiesterase CpdA n=1 Tax=Marinobacterium mangrovicola TaxID=1476959 RepID=A0A4R1GK33_9GAMM|nr:metallophosphoesterase [Marinobacterium mangrovicola]TCK08757.1 3',5'-cyclic AMP phosphodiesterase CpdA [Marinobacterium mangrovicola]
MRILHLSDPHFGTIPELVRQQMEEQVHALSPDLIILSGDITQRSKEHEFEQAGAFVERMPDVPLVAVPGNHDISLFNLPRRLFDPYGLFEKTFGRLPPFAIEKGGVQVIALNSAPRWRHINGEIDASFLREKLAEYIRTPAQLRIAVLHHPLDCRRMQDRYNLTRGHRRAVEVLSEYGIDLVLGGHIHDTLMRTSEHRFPRIFPRMLMLLAGTCMSSRTRLGAPNSFNLIDQLEEQIVQVQRWDLGKESGVFHPVEQGRFSRDDKGWALVEYQRPDHPERPAKKQHH